MISLVVSVAFPLLVLSQSESSCHGKPCQLDDDQFAMLQAKVHQQDIADQLVSSDRKPTCASEGHDVYEQNTYAAPNPVACCDGQAVTNVDGKFLCPLKTSSDLGAGEEAEEAGGGGKATCASEGRDVYEENTYAAPNPVACCDGQAVTNVDGKFLCPPKTCAHSGQDVYDAYTFKGHTPVACCDGQAPADQNGKQLCPPKPCAHSGQDVYDNYTFKGFTPVACCDGQAPANQNGKELCPAKVCAHPGQDVYDDYTFKGHTPVECCDGKQAANHNGKKLCPGEAAPTPSPLSSLTEAWDKQIWCDGGRSPRGIDPTSYCGKYTCDEKHYISCCGNLKLKQKEGECWGSSGGGCRYHCA
jgi:hypothetical protein